MYAEILVAHSVIDRGRFELMREKEEAAALSESESLMGTSSSEHGVDATLETAKRLGAFGHTVTAHLAARTCISLLLYLPRRGFSVHRQSLFLQNW